MIDQLTLQTIGILLTGLTVSIAAIYYTLTLRYTRRNQELTLKAQQQSLETRQISSWMELIKHTTTPEWIKRWQIVYYTYNLDDFDTYLQKYSAATGHFDESTDIFVIGEAYNTIGNLVRTQNMPLDIFSRSHFQMVIMTWKKIETICFGLRERFPGFHLLWCDFEYLYNRVLDYLKQHPELQPPNIESSPDST
jgi:hypothetical protein